jgi:hypothetical protein
MNESKTKVNAIHTVTCFVDIPPFLVPAKDINERQKKMSDYYAHGGDRCFGWFTSRKKAIKAVLENQNDLHEYSYKYAVVEKIGEGIHGMVRYDQAAWYQWNDENDGFELIERPAACDHIIGWGIG